MNDFVLFTIAGGGSLLSGLVYSSYGWDALIYACSIMVCFAQVTIEPPHIFLDAF